MANVTIDTTAVHTYLGNLQNVISRMASNSASSKTWCITIVSAVLAFVVDNATPEAIWIAMVPIVLFFLLDAYYLGLERSFRGRYDEFVKKLHAGTARTEDVFEMKHVGGMSASFTNTIGSIASTSIWPFYLAILVLVILLANLVL